MAKKKKLNEAGYVAIRHHLAEGWSWHSVPGMLGIGTNCFLRMVRDDVILRMLKPKPPSYSQAQEKCIPSTR